MRKGEKRREGERERIGQIWLNAACLLGSPYQFPADDALAGVRIPALGMRQRRQCQTNMRTPITS